MADGHTKAKATPTHSNIFAAFCEAQASFGEVVKSSKGHKGKYAPLDAVLAAIVPALNECGLILSQPTVIEGNALLVETRIVHAATGECMSCMYPVGELGKPHQEMGASLSYAKRYSVLSLCGVAPENEDDADNRESTPTARKISQQAAPERPVEQKQTPRTYTLEERVRACKAHLSKALDKDDCIIRWEDQRTEALRNELKTKEPQMLAGLADYYGQVLSRFDEDALV